MSMTSYIGCQRYRGRCWHHKRKAVVWGV